MHSKNDLSRQIRFRVSLPFALEKGWLRNRKTAVGGLLKGKPSDVLLIKIFKRQLRTSLGWGSRSKSRHTPGCVFSPEPTAQLWKIPKVRGKSELLQDERDKKMGKRLHYHAIILFLFLINRLCCALAGCVSRHCATVYILLDTEVFFIVYFQLDPISQSVQFKIEQMKSKLREREWGCEWKKRNSPQTGIIWKGYYIYSMV